jgi:hypothetical protein
VVVFVLAIVSIQESRQTKVFQSEFPPGIKIGQPCKNDFIRGVDQNEVNEISELYMDKMLELVSGMHKGNLPTTIHYESRNNIVEPQNGTRYQMVIVHSPCPDKIKIGPERSDGSKFFCGISSIKSASSSNPVTVFSIGSKENTIFEDSFLSLLPNSIIHTFDCTLPNKSWTPANSKIHFHPWCLSDKDDVFSGQQYYSFLSLLTLTNTTSTENLVLKMDIEQFEWSVFEKWRRDMILPHQILVELHYEGYMFSRERSSGELGLLMLHLYRLGYRVASREDNHDCFDRCTELVLLRYICY